MRAGTFLNLPIEPTLWETLAPTCPEGFNGPGYLFNDGAVSIPFDWCSTSRPECDVLIVGKP